MQKGLSGCRGKSGTRAAFRVMEEDHAAILASRSTNVMPLIISVFPFGGPGSVSLLFLASVLQLPGVLNSYMVF